ncbi:MAG: exodeoxyribonuclease III [Candidatus Eisenbacteria sp.]|nr:exodeoxyribonuclease III [Candidatus Eisenbacteria bacterium]
MKIATWNVNSVRARLPRLEAWLGHERPDLLCMQESKVTDELFPRETLEALGYRLDVFGQKTYNGVALAARKPVSDIVRGLPDDSPDAERRLISATLEGIRIVNVYVPNGTALGTPRFTFKLEWFARLREMLAATASPDDPLLLCGDFNVAPEDRDVHDPEKWRGRLLFHPAEHAALRPLFEWGLIDAFRALHPEARQFTWWDYRAGAFHRGWGLRIDLMLMTPSLAARCREVRIDREARKGEKPSDHAPVIAEID